MTNGIIYPEKFLRLYDDEIELAEAAYTSEMDAKRAEWLFGSPGTVYALETTIVGMMLLDPGAADVRDVIGRVDPAVFDIAEHRLIWLAAQGGASSLRDLVYRLWSSMDVKHGRELPDSARRALGLHCSRNWISTAGLSLWANKYLETRRARDLSREIRTIVGRMADGDLSPLTCLDQLALLRERVAIHGR